MHTVNPLPPHMQRLTHIRSWGGGLRRRGRPAAAGGRVSRPRRRRRGASGGARRGCRRCRRSPPPPPRPPRPPSSPRPRRSAASPRWSACDAATPRRSSPDNNTPPSRYAIGTAARGRHHAAAARWRHRSTTSAGVTTPARI